MSEPTDRSPADELLTDLDQRPELAAGLRSRVVPPEVLALPQTIAEIAAMVKDTTALVQRTAERQDQLTKSQEQLAQRQDQTDTQIAEFRATVNDFIAEQRQINAQQQETNARHDATLAELKVMRLEQEKRTETMRQQIADSDQRSNHLYGRVSDIAGQRAEQLVASQLRDCIFDHDQNLTEVTVLRCRTINEPNLAAQIEDATRQRRITHEERRQLLQADIIAQAVHRQTQETRYFVIEVSINIHDTDLDRAAARAQIYSKVLNQPVQPLTIGGRVHPSHQAYAATSPVPTLFHPRLEPEQETNQGNTP